MSDEIQIHNNQFAPPTAGRPPKADISKLIYAAAQNPNTWVSQVMENKDAASAMGQLKRKGYQCSSSTLDAQNKTVYCMYSSTGSGES